MQPSGQAWAQVLHPVQRSTNQTRFVRARGGMGRSVSGNSKVVGSRTRCLTVVSRPLAMPIP